jgi:SNF2 family DNA or RNA helicase
LTEHQFAPGENEVEKLGKSLKGLVGVWLKSECLDLPEMSFETIKINPTADILQIAEAAAASAGRGADALIKLRTISDGFRYKEIDSGRRQTCEGCVDGKVFQYIDEDAPHDPLSENERESGYRYDGSKKVKIASIKKLSIDCYTCLGTGEVVLYDRHIEPVDSPKLEVLEALLQEHEEVGRLNVFAGFEGSIVRIVERCLSLGWDVLRVDGKGWKWYRDEEFLALDANAMLGLYQKEAPDWPDKVVFVGQPGAAGMGLTLHAAPTTVFYSNDFNPESRIQACSRGHRIGMLQNGGKIIDLVHLPTDQQIIDSLNNSQRLQSISLDAVKACVRSM